MDPGFDWSSYTGRGAVPRYREHGTARGYFQHVNRGEYACRPCKRARTTLRWSVAQWLEYERLRAAGVNPGSATILAAMIRADRRRTAA